jgi:phage terminase large subunit-like protein
MSTGMSIDRALADRRLLGAALGDLGSWSTWLVVLKAAFGLPLSDAEIATFCKVAGDRPPPGKQVKELWCVCARRSGKSRVAAALAVYLALFQQHKLARGEVGHVLTLAPTADQARTVFQYCSGFVDGSDALRREVVSTTATEIKLRNNCVTGVHACSHRSVRGRTLLATIFDETAFWRDEASATPDVEVYRAVMPSLIARRRTTAWACCTPSIEIILAMPVMTFSSSRAIVRRSIRPCRPH